MFLLKFVDLEVGMTADKILAKILEQEKTEAEEQVHHFLINLYLILNLVFHSQMTDQNQVKEHKIKWPKKFTNKVFSNWICMCSFCHSVFRNRFDRNDHVGVCPERLQTLQG